MLNYSEKSLRKFFSQELNFAESTNSCTAAELQNSNWGNQMQYLARIQLYTGKRALSKLSRYVNLFTGLEFFAAAKSER